MYLMWDEFVSPCLVHTSGNDCFGGLVGEYFLHCFDERAAVGGGNCCK